ncbi:hypothetical protein TVAG_112130 [Trichomonas vaginalis G3]|uniref:Uncharacterized protein n=1 Tax=Trichomonas vaginalis (strain ATCC PRA-98 / G3) TaxID=412133 RepID=A2G3Y7_TRIV3|nr:hypothetical protein TVAGG3_0870760 [Trichomonas vaginalis G3]EAX88132.1 hypothetical protein TVAG_112130 [Trichomonas vaginalis G3]KAI5501349.1 hypothetical protein TVAGG3_0870760 [Trichomonas vaginalis G3]|eukprot:XP_001301062.1 hypothetical protein [Trichomonas vaginalis G3]
MSEEMPEIFQFMVEVCKLEPPYTAEDIFSTWHRMYRTRDTNTVDGQIITLFVTHWYEQWRDRKMGKLEFMQEFSNFHNFYIGPVKEALNKK